MTMNVYLDNNIFIDIEAGNLDAESFLKKKDCLYYYSDAHLNELLEGKDNPKISQEGRLELIKRICGNQCIIPGGYCAPEYYDRNPKDVYAICSISPIRPLLIEMLNSNNASFKKIRQQLGFNSSWLNNVAPDNVLVVLDERMKDRLNIGLLDYLIRTEAFNGKPLYHTLINIIDTAKYWADKKTSHSSVAQFFDAAHAYYAQICDILVTNDKRMRAKASAVYSFLDIKTGVVSSSDFFRIVTDS